LVPPEKQVSFGTMTPNLSLDPNTSPAALVRRPFGAG